MKPGPNALLALMLIAAGGARAQDAAARGPQPDLEPAQVVEAMLLALRKDTDQGLAELYRFSSPGNRLGTGPLERFRAMIRLEFSDLLGHRSARTAPPLIDGDRALVPVEITARDAERHHYIFLFSRQDIPECRGCWMADAVVPPEAFDAPQDAEPAAPEPGAPGPGLIGV